MPIPRILFRTVPATTDAQTEAWWEASVALTPGWEHITYRDEIDRALFPITSPYWDRCSSGAQKAGLIRLEALHNHGGVYLDSDAELWHPVGSLLQLRGFAAWEDKNTIPDAIMGFELGHPVIPVMIQEAVSKLEQGAWESGPGVSTRNLQGRDDVLLLPPQSWYPMHWSRKTRYDMANDRGRRAQQQLRDTSPFTFGVHNWRHSWKGA